MSFAHSNSRSSLDSAEGQACPESPSRIKGLATPSSVGSASTTHSSWSYRLLGFLNLPAKDKVEMEVLHVPWHVRLASLTERVAVGSLVALSALSTAFLLGMTIFLFAVRDLYQPCAGDVFDFGQTIREGAAGSWSPSMLSFYHHVHCTWGLLKTLVIMPATVWLLAVAQTADLRRTASYAAVIWGNSALSEVGDVVNCFDPHSPLAKVFNKPSHAVGSLLLSISIAQFTSLMVSRLETLEDNWLQHLSVRKMRLMMYFLSSLSLLGLPVIYMADIMGYRQICGIMMWLLLVLLLGFYSAATHSLVGTLWLTRGATQNVPPHLAFEAQRAVRTIRAQLCGMLLSGTTTFLLTALGSWRLGWLWPLPEIPNELEFGVFAVERVVYFLDGVCNLIGALALSGALSGAARGAAARAAITRDRKRRWSQAAMQWTREKKTKEGKPAEQQTAWDSKVQELAGRGISLRALLKFYRGLGSKYMPHFDPTQHRTSDVVRHAIIPMSSQYSCAFAEVLMKRVPTRPNKMVTHNWSNLFRDLVAAVIADALEEPDYQMIAFLLMCDFKQVERWVLESGLGSKTYWICAFAVNQHLGICGANPHDSVDSVTGELHPTCSCGLEKAWNDTKPTLPDGRSIPCEMNKFDAMMRFLSATDPKFEQVVAVDAGFTLFTRAWCIAEIVAANAAGMPQCLKINSPNSLTEHAEDLHALKIEAMEATRPEDKQQILDSIEDIPAFDKALHNLIFEDLVPAWDSLDGEEQLARVGRIMRWQHVRMQRGTRFMWDAVA